MPAKMLPVNAAQHVGDLYLRSYGKLTLYALRHSRRPSISTIVDYVFWLFSVFLVEGWGAILTDGVKSILGGRRSHSPHEWQPPSTGADGAGHGGLAPAAVPWPSSPASALWVGRPAIKPEKEIQPQTAFGTVFSLLALRGWRCSREPKLHMGSSRNKDFQESTH